MVVYPESELESRLSLLWLWATSLNFIDRLAFTAPVFSGFVIPFL